MQITDYGVLRTDTGQGEGLPDPRALPLSHPYSVLCTLPRLPSLLRLDLRGATATTGTAAFPPMPSRDEPAPGEPAKGGADAGAHEEEVEVHKAGASRLTNW